MRYILGVVVGTLATVIGFTVKDTGIFITLLAVVSFGGAALDQYIS